MSFDQLGLRTELLKAIESKGYISPTPVQAMAIPVILDGQDVLARAQTGTGKTDAFALPIVEILSRSKNRDRQPRALVLAPTRELALQVGESIKAYARRVSLRCTVVYGGVKIEPQIERLKRGIDILVATPGRLLDLAGMRYFTLSMVEFLVFDEADRMLDMGFSEDISRILEFIPEERRTMLFSATYTKQIRDLADEMLINPRQIEVTPDTTAAESVIQKAHMVEQENKEALLTHLIKSKNWDRTLVFTRTRHGANKLMDKLASQKISVAVMHGDKSQSLRIKTLEAFKNNEVRILIATDVAARGLDISELPCVVNYDMPAVPEDYVHRIGRTGRAGESGTAVSFVSSSEKVYLKAVEKLINRKIPIEKVSGYTEGSELMGFLNIRNQDAMVDKDVAQAVKEYAARKNRQKQTSEKSKPGTKNSRKNSRPVSKKQSGKKIGKSGNTSSRSGKPSKQGNTNRRSGNKRQG